MCGAGEEDYPTVNAASLAATLALNRRRRKVCRRGFARGMGSVGQALLVIRSRVELSLWRKFVDDLRQVFG